jgi:hypothetical protein
LKNYYFKIWLYVIIYYRGEVNVYWCDCCSCLIISCTICI